MIVWEQLGLNERLALQQMCEASFSFFARSFFMMLQGQKLVWNWHHSLICDELQAVYEGRENRLIINCPPGGTKTELFSVAFAPWCILRSIADGRKDKSKATSTRWLPISYSDDLVKENSSRVRDILRSEEFQACWPLTPSPDTNQKHNWEFYDEHKNRHAMYGTSLFGQVMGRRAGFMQDGNTFTGAMLIDDPLPTKDDGSFVRMDKANKALNRILRSRLARDRVPIIMIQQRIAVNDTTDYLLSEKTPDTYKRVIIPAMIDRKYVEALPVKHREHAVRDTGFKDEPVSYWDWKEPTASLLKMKKADPYLFSSQYQQKPDEAFLAGLIYRQALETLIAQGRALDFIPIEPALAVDTWWDLGINDDMSIWLTQKRGFETRLIAFYKNRDKGMEHYINWLHDFRDKFGIRFGKHHGPHDLAVRELTSGVSRKDTATKMGISFKMIQRPQIKRDAINASLAVFPQLWIDTKRCEFDCLAKEGENTWPIGRGGWSALNKYQREYDEDLEVFGNEPLHNWASHPCDAFQGLGLVTQTVPGTPGYSTPNRSGGSAHGWQGS